MKTAILAIEASQDILNILESKLRECGYKCSTAPGIIRIPVDGILGVTELFGYLNARTYVYYEHTFMSMDDDVFRINSVSLIQAGLVSAINSVNLNAAIRTLEFIASTDLGSDIFTSDLAHILASDVIRRHPGHYTRIANGNRDLEDVPHRPFWDNDGPSPISANARKRGRLSVSRKERSEFNLRPKRKLTGAPLHTDQGLREHGLMRRKAAFRGWPITCKDLTPETVWVESVHSNKPGCMDVEYELHIGDEVFQTTINDGVITFKGLDGFLNEMYGDSTLEEHITNLALVSLFGGDPQNSDDSEIIIAPPDTKVRFRPSEAGEHKKETSYVTVDVIGTPKVNEGNLEVTFKLTTSEELKQFKLPISVRSVNYDDSIVITLDDVITAYMDENIVTLNSPKAVSNRIWEAFIKTNNLPKYSCVAFVGEQNSASIRIPVDRIYTESLDSPYCMLLTNMLKATFSDRESNASEETTPVNVETTAHSSKEVTTEQWNEIMAEGNSAFADTDKRKSVDAKVVKGILFLREGELVYPVDWKTDTKTGDLALDIHGLDNLSSYRKGNYVKAIMEALNINPDNIKDTYFSDSKFCINFNSVRAQILVTTETLTAYSIQETPELPKPTTRMTSAEIVEAIREDDDCTKTNVIDFHNFNDGVRLELIKESDDREDIWVMGLFERIGNRKRYYGAAVNQLGRSLADVFVNSKFAGEYWVADTRKDGIVLRNYETLTDVPDSWVKLNDDQTIDDLAVLISKGKAK